MRAKKITFDFFDFSVTIILQPKSPPRPDNDNDQREYWGDDMKSLLDRYLEK